MPNTTVPAAAAGLPASEPYGRIQAGARANVIPIAEMPRRAFLKHLAKLPLIGGAVGALGLIAQPEAVAEPVTPALLDAYKSWLLNEYMHVCQELDPGRPIDFGFAPNNAGGMYHWRAFGQPPAPAPSTRAAIVLSAVGCDWKDWKGAPRYV